MPSTLMLSSNSQSNFQSSQMVRFIAPCAQFFVCSLLVNFKPDNVDID